MKRMTALLLAVMMALSLCACGEKEEESPIGPADGPESSLSAAVGSNQQITGTLSGLFGSKEGADLYEKYKDIIDALEDKNYNRAIHEIVVLSNAGKPQAEKASIEAYFTGDWHLNVDDSYPDSPKVLTLSDAGTVKLDGAAYNWLENGKSSNNLSGWLLKDGVHTYYLSLSMSTDNLTPQVSLYTAKPNGNEFTSDKSMGVYYNDAMLGWAFDSWQNLDNQDKVMPRSFSLNRNRLSVNSTDHSWTVTKTGGNAISFAIGDAYTLDVELRGVRPVATLTDKATGSSANYRTSEHGYDERWKEYIYPEAMHYLAEVVEDMREGYTPAFHSYLEPGDTTVYYQGNAALKYLYDLFAGLGDYKDSAQILAKFTVQAGMHTHTSLTHTDNMGNTGTDKSHELFTYDAQGRLIRGESEQLYRLYGGSEGNYKYLFYNDQGHLVQVTDGTGNYTSARMDLTCDDQGRPVSGNYKTNYYSETLSYSYDDQGRLAESIAWYGETRIWSTYTYDAQGRLATIVRWDGNKNYNLQDTRYTTTYAYDDQGRLVSQITKEEYYDSWDKVMMLRHTTTISCTSWNAQGRPLTADYSYVNARGESSYASQTLEYHYDDLYFYQDLTFAFNP